jgi:hypothetical protein
VNAPQSVLDCIADAETLRLVYRSHFRGFRFSHTSLAKALTLADRIEPNGPWLGMPDGPARYARSAARAAFRAVPALRVESPIVTVCQECGRVKGGRPVPEGARLSHGIGPECWDATREAAGLKPAPFPGGEW